MISRLLIFLKGLAMGAADVVPGVSGGTIAFITGIYDELLSSINSVSFKLIGIWRKEGFLAVWKAVNGNFLLPLFLGIATSFLTLASVFKWLLAEHPHLLWAFFFGLIIGSIWLVGKMVGKWDFITIMGIAVGTLVSFGLTKMEPGLGSDQYWFIFVSGAIAICAMILPGISGSFILLLLGVYSPMLDAVHNLDFGFIGILGAGALVGLLSFSRLLKWTLDNYYDVTIAVLIGFLIGSLNKIWPWKETLQFRINSHGESVPFIQENIMPANYPNAQVIYVLGLAILGMGLILLLSRFSPNDEKE
jgi:putative membrane protein